MGEAMTITAEQVKAARAQVGWSQGQLAEAARVSAITVKRFEASGAFFNGHSSTCEKLQAALEAAGVAFTDCGEPNVKTEEGEAITTSAVQLKAARALLGWSRIKLAVESGVGENLIKTFEAGARIPASAKLDALKQTLEAAGVEIDSRGQRGVRLRKATK
jgi:transcriptional regulator with XRE-family HTH domain